MSKRPLHPRPRGPYLCMNSDDISNLLADLSDDENAETATGIQTEQDEERVPVIRSLSQSDSTSPNPSITEPKDLIIEVSSDTETEDDEDEPCAKRKSTRPKSVIWTQFMTTKDSTNKILSNKCLGCMKNVSAKADRMKKHIENCRFVKKNTIKLPTTAQVTSSDAPSSVSPTKTIMVNPFKQATMEKYAAQIPAKNKKAIDLQLGRFLFSTDLSFNVVESEEFKKFVNLLNPAYKAPGRMTIGSTILEEIDDETTLEMKIQLKGKNVCMIQDGWSTNQNQPVIAHCVSTIGKSYFIQAEGTGSEKKTHEYCYHLLDEAIIKAENDYGCKVVGIVTDNCKSMQSLHLLCKTMRPELFAYGCNSHLLNLLGSHFTPEDIQEKVSVVQKFMRNHHYLSATLLEMGAKRPVLPGTTRWNSQIDSFLNYCENHAKYLEVSRNYQVHIQKGKKDDKDKLKVVLEILNSSVFYDSIKRLINVLKPICVALDKLQGGCTTLADAILSWLELRDSLPEYILEDSYYKKQEDLGITDAALAAYILHPKYKGSRLSSELKNRGLNVIVESSPLNVIAAMELTNYRTNYFYTAFLKPEVCGQMDPLSWWKAAATNQVPEELKILASKLFVLPSSTGGVERSFSTLGNIMTKQRNRLSIEKGSKLCRIHNFLKLQQQEIDVQRESKLRPVKKRLFPDESDNEAPASVFSAPASSSYAA